MWRRCVVWATTPHGRRMIALKLLITGCMLAIFFHNYLGQVLGCVGSLIWLWFRIEE